MDGTIAMSSQSMPLYYDNTTGAGGSETQRTLDPPQDWTAHGIKSLSLSFRGEGGNTGQLYVKINGTKVTYNGIPNAIEKSAWLSMIVDLSTVTADLSAVTSLAIGIEGAGAQGVVYLDDMLLYPLTATMLEPVAPTDNDPDLVGLWKLDDGNGTTATDASGNNRHGVLTNGPLWAADGAMGGALVCDGVDDYVVLNTISYGDASSADFSVALWVKTDGWESDAAIISNKDWNSGGNAGWAIAGGAGNNGSFQWNFSDGSNRADFDPSVAVSPISGGGWCHLCVTHDRDGQARFYYDGQLIGEVDISDITGSLDADFPTVLGTDGSEAAVWAYWFTGAFDDVRIYNRVLSEGEVLGLTGVTVPVPQPF
ncbi:MAG: LamG domain-containing protein [Planctomycetes bacterium]|nr:LamG domain-containing protein [Planctomycetota bacterium]